MKQVFKTCINTNIALSHTRKKATKDLTTIRCCSKPLYEYFKINFPELMEKATQKRIPNLVRTLNHDLKKNILATSFKGDGFIDSERFGYSTSSYGLAKDYQDFLLNMGIYSYISTAKRTGKMSGPSYKVVVSGLDSMRKFVDEIVESDDYRLEKLKIFIQRSGNKNNDRDVVPQEIAKKIRTALKALRLDDGYFYNISNRKFNVHQKTAYRYITKIEARVLKCKKMLTGDEIRLLRKKLGFSVSLLAKEMKVSSSTICNLEKKKDPALRRLVHYLANNKIKKLSLELKKLKQCIFSDLCCVKIKSVKKVRNENVQWVYDITIEPNHAFISEGLVLHNTVSISKANIQATLRCETTVLAAANPKFGRFDPYDLIANQIDLPPTLINRFDLIFPIKDLPNREKDEQTASFILRLHQEPGSTISEIPTELLKKYFMYIRKKVVPKIMDEAIAELKEYYVGMRNMGGGEETGIKSIPITARQLEALVRLSEAAAKIRLSEVVTKEDARKAIELIDYCLNQIAKDAETGKIDIDRLSSRITATQRSSISVIKEIISTIEEQSGDKIIPVENIIDAAREKNIAREQVEETLEKLRRSGDIFEPKRGFVQKL